MNIVLLGYMASGKSIIGQKLAKMLNWQFIDLDEVISTKEKVSIREIFKTKGEIYFRKIEKLHLEETLLNSDKAIIALGGGTPCYSNNMSLINQTKNTISIYLRVSIPELSKRLNKDKTKRPLVAHISSIDDMTEFVGKHLFERMAYYNQAHKTIDANADIDKTVEEILLELF